MPYYDNLGLLRLLATTLCPHKSHSTPLRKTLTVDYYLRIDYFQQEFSLKARVMACDPKHSQIFHDLMRWIYPPSHIYLAGRGKGVQKGSVL